MKNIREIITTLKENGYSQNNAEARLCQDIVLSAIADSRLNRNITVKGGVVMRSITGSLRRATVDMDLDFIRYSLSDEAISHFIQILDEYTPYHLRITGNIEELRQQDYQGKRVYIQISDDENYTIVTKIDLGVHNRLEIEQEEYCFDVCMDEDGASLLINSLEQMLTEKLKSLLKFGIVSTRFKDIFDIYYLTSKTESAKLQSCLQEYIFSDKKMRENTVADIHKRLKKIFQDRRFIQKVKTSRKNWLDVSETEAMAVIVSYFDKLI